MAWNDVLLEIEDELQRLSSPHPGAGEPLVQEEIESELRAVTGAPTQETPLDDWRAVVDDINLELQKLEPGPRTEAITAEINQELYNLAKRRAEERRDLDEAVTAGADVGYGLQSETTGLEELPAPVKNVPKEMVGMVVRPLVGYSEAAYKLGGLAAQGISEMLPGGRLKEAATRTAQALGRTGLAVEDFRQSLETPYTDPYADLGFSLLLGGGGGALAHRLMRDALPAAARAVAGYRGATGIGAVTAGLGDALMVNRILERTEPLIDRAELEPWEKTVLKTVVTLGTGVLSAATLESAIARSLGDPYLRTEIRRSLRDGDVEEVFERMRQAAGPASEWSPEISARMTQRWRQWQERAQEVKGAERLREDEGQVHAGGVIREGSQTEGGSDLERLASERPGGSAREETSRPKVIDPVSLEEIEPPPRPKPPQAEQYEAEQYKKMAETVSSIAPVDTPSAMSRQKANEELTALVPEPVKRNVSALMATPGLPAGLDPQVDEDGNVRWELDWDKVALGALAVAGIHRIGVTRRSPLTGVRLRGVVGEAVQSFVDRYARAIRHYLPEWDGVRTAEEALEVASAAKYLTPTVTDEPIKPRYLKPQYEVRGNAKMGYPTRAFPEGRITLDIPGCGREQWAKLNGIVGEHPLGYSGERPCYGGACYADTLARAHGGSVASGTRKFPVGGRQRQEILRLIEDRGLEAAQKAYPDLTIAKRQDNTISIARIVRTVEEGEGAKVSTNIPPLKGMDVRLGVDTDGGAWLADKRVLDALLTADPGIVTVFTSAYHNPPPPHPLSRRTIINVTLSGYFPVPEQISRLRYAERARGNGWNVILRYVSADPSVFTQEEGRLYNRAWEAVHETDYAIMQQPLHRGTAMGAPIHTPAYPACCIGSARNPKTCDLCEVAEGLGEHFGRYWGIYQSRHDPSEQILPDFPERRIGAWMRTPALPPGLELPPATNVRRLKGHPDYAAAKAGDLEAARRVVADVLPQETVDWVRERYGKDVTIVPAGALEGGNALPQAIAEHLAKELGAELGPPIRRITPVGHTGATMAERLIRRPTYAPEGIVAGKRYLIVDDVITSGSSVAEIADTIKAAGGDVAGVVPLVNASRGRTLTGGEYHGRVPQEVAESYGGVEVEALTRPEHDYLSRFTSLERLRDTRSEAVSQRSPRELRTEDSEEALRAYIRSGTQSGHPALGVLGGVSGIEVDDDGHITVDPGQFTLGIIGGAVGLAGIHAARRLVRPIYLAASHQWDAKVAQPILDLVSRSVDHLITSADLRRLLGMAYEPEVRKSLQEYRAQAAEVLRRAAEMGQRLAEIAPTKLEQRRLMQVLRGSVTVNEEWARRAEEVRRIFDQLRADAERLEILHWSRYDAVTRRERARLREIANGIDPLTAEDKALREFAQRHNIPRGKRQTYRDAVANAQAQARARLWHWDHSYNAGYYVPRMYGQYEGLSPSQIRVLKDEARTVHARMVRAVPGTPEREALEREYYEILDLIERGSKRSILTSAKSAPKLDAGWVRQRQDLPPEVMRLLGVIEEAPYPVSKGMATQGVDILTHKLLKAIADDPQWAQIPRKGEELGAEWKVVNGKQWGALDGMAVRRTVLEDLREVIEMRGPFLQLYDEMLTKWKLGKTVLNPATWARNCYSNIILAWLGDLSPTDVGTYRKAIEDYLKKGKYYQEAAPLGIYTDTWLSNEIRALRDDLDKIRDPKGLRYWLGRAFALAAQGYDSVDKIFRHAVYVRKRLDGMSVEDAADYASRTIFSYSDLPPLIRYARRISPWIAWTYRVSGRLGEIAIRKPWKLAALAALAYGAETASGLSRGWTRDELESRKTEWEQWRRKSVLGVPTHILTPWDDQWGNPLTLDLTYILPYGTWGEQWGQSRLPFRDALVSHPAFDLLSAIYTNVDPFTGRTLAHEYADDALDYVQKLLELSWRAAVPPLAPGGTSYSKIVAGIKNLWAEVPEKDWAGRPVELSHAILSTILGVKLTPVQAAELARKRESLLNRIKRDFAAKEAEVREQLRRGKITHEEATRQIREARELMGNMTRKLGRGEDL